MNDLRQARFLARASRIAFATLALVAWAGPSHGGTRHVVVEFAADSGSVVTGAGDAWTTNTSATDCNPATTPPVAVSCGIDFTNAPSTGNTTAAIDMGFSINIGGTATRTLYIDRFGFVTFKPTSGDGSFTFTGDLAGLQALLVDGSNNPVPFVAPFYANLAIPDQVSGSFAPFAGGASYFRGSGDPIPPYNVSEELPAFAVTWFNDTGSGAPAIAAQMVIYQKNAAGDFYLALRYGQSDSDPPYDISGTSALPAIAGFSLSSTPSDQLSLAGPLPDANGYFYEFDNGHLATSAALALACPSSTAQTGVAYNSTLAASGGASPYAYAVTVGSLPAGLTLAAGTGAISGTPTAGGVAGFTGTVTDSATPTAGTASQSCTITVNQAPAITSSATASFALGAPVAFTVTATGFPAPTFAATGLPAGLVLASNGVLSGTPTASGTYTATVTARNGVAPDAVQSLVVRVNAAAALTISPAALNFGTVTQYSVTSKPVTLTNGGSAAISIGSVSIVRSGTSPARDFVSASLCGSTLAPGKQCRIYVTLLAVDPGVLSARLRISDSAAGSPQQVPLSATVVKRRR